jgi:hypothetical protein
MLVPELVFVVSYHCAVAIFTMADLAGIRLIISPTATLKQSIRKPYAFVLTYE